MWNTRVPHKTLEQGGTRWVLPKYPPLSFLASTLSLSRFIPIDIALSSLCRISSVQVIISPSQLSVSTLDFWLGFSKSISNFVVINFVEPILWLGFSKLTPKIVYSSNWFLKFVLGFWKFLKIDSQNFWNSIYASDSRIPF